MHEEKNAPHWNCSYCRVKSSLTRLKPKAGVAGRK